jgi:hypothetical protein
MSTFVVVQALAWLAAFWLAGMHLLVQRGRFPAEGRAIRAAAAAAAGSLIAAAVLTRFWPLVALGLIWLRIEVFRHGDRAETHPPSHLWARLWDLFQKAMAWLLKIEILAIVLIILFVLGQRVRDVGIDFDRRSDGTLCHLLADRC